MTRWEFTLQRALETAAENLRMLFIGDVHGLFPQYQSIIDGTPDDTCQLGDMGLGFGRSWPEKFPTKDRFIRGNHDNPAICRRHPNYLGEYGIIPEISLFYLSGAWSIDQLLRTAGIDWWADEQLYKSDLDSAVALYTQVKPSFVVTHDCPTSVRKTMFKGRPAFNTRTDVALQEMLDAHVPTTWLFGHHHVLWKNKISNCDFICLDELSTHSIPDMKWPAKPQP